MGHKDSMVLVEQIAVRSQVQYKQEYLATLFTSDTLYGVKAVRAAASTGAAAGTLDIGQELLVVSCVDWDSSGLEV